MRGKEQVAPFGAVPVGITPAYAGKRDCHGRWRAYIKDHPRVCGEKSVTYTLLERCGGSPPRMRGKDGVNDSAQAVTGITPAYAGKSAWRCSGIVPCWDHPRVCGEKTARLALWTWALGSPPRMRGKDKAGQAQRGYKGITPAYAGKRGIKLSIASMIWDHPRVCGEKAVCWPLVWIIWGSPPRVRGKAGRALEGACIPGITPAYAGKSRSQGSHTAPPGDHPRVCGEKSRYAVQSIVK